ncbi:radical SAM family heme chaperone HemW [bacterium]|nr:radical SAM family heme chaperone HemW [bacterium]
MVQPVSAHASSDQPAKTFGIYIHVPFCRRKCNYCDFYSVAVTDELLDAYIRALECEINWVASYLPADQYAATLYCGGGSPSLINLVQLERIREILFGSFRFERDFEWTMEANPESFTSELMLGWQALGVNRISMGVQSLQPSLLKLLGRCHSAFDARIALETLKAGPCINWSVDCMCGIPGQTLTGWLEDLAEVRAYGPAHLSVYPLSLEPGTAMAERVRRGELDPSPEELVADQLEAAEAKLHDWGYEHYEIANYALSGQRCRHNLGYWLRTPYIGLGPAAATFWNETRSNALASLEHYLHSQVSDHTSMEHSLDPFERPFHHEVERLDRKAASLETILLGTRLLDGFDLQKWCQDYQSEIEPDLLGRIEEQVRIGLLERSGCIIRLSRRGRWLANKVWLDFVD